MKPVVGGIGLFCLLLGSAGCRSIGIAPVATAGILPSSEPYDMSKPSQDLGPTKGNALSMEILWFDVQTFEDAHQKALKEALQPVKGDVLTQVTWSEYTLDLFFVKGTWYTVRGRALALPYRKAAQTEKKK